MQTRLINFIFRLLMPEGLIRVNINLETKPSNGLLKTSVGPKRPKSQTKKVDCIEDCHYKYIRIIFIRYIMYHMSVI